MPGYVTEALLEAVGTIIGGRMKAREPKFAAAEVPGGAINGVNVNFTLAHAPKLLWLTKNGVILREGAGLEFTRNGANLTLTVAPSGADGDWLSANYIW